VHAVEEPVVAGVHDRRESFGMRAGIEAAEEASGSDAACEGDEVR
jgi:hypothetical protein